MKKKVINFLEKILRTDIRYVIKGYFWFGIEHSVSIITGIATAFVFANFLLPQTYGTFKYVLALLPFLNISTLKRMNDSLTVSVAKGFEGDTINVLKTKMKWGLLGSLAGLLLSLYYYFNDNNTLSLLIIVMAIFIPLFNTPLIYTSFLLGKKKFKVSSIINSSVSIIYALAIIITLLLSKDVFIILIAYFSTNTLLRFGSLIYTLKKYPPNKNKEAKTLGYGKKINVLSVVETVSTSIDNILVFHYLGAIELAAYVFIKKVPESIKFIPRFLTTLSTPKFSAKNIGDPFIKKEVVRKTWIFYSGIAVLTLIYILMAPFIFEILFKPYKEYVFLSQIYALSFAFNFGGLFLNFIEVNRKLKSVLSLHITTSLLTILVVFISLKFYGLLGLVIGFSIIRFVNSLIRYTFFKKATQ